MAAELQVQLVGFKDRIRVAEHELAKQAPVLAQLTHSNQNMGNRVSVFAWCQNHATAFKQYLTFASASWMAA